MRRQYFAHYYRDFGNTYNLMYADTEEDLKYVPEDARRITRREAESLCIRENYRRKHDFGGFADNAIYPAKMTSDEIWGGSRKYYKVGYIYERRTK